MFDGRPISDRARSRLGRTAFAGALALSVALLLLAAALLRASDPNGRFLPDLGIFELSIPAGAHFVALPLVESEGTDLPAVFGPGWAALGAVASYDPAKRTWGTWFPQRPAPADGDRKLHGQVLRIHVSQPTTLALRGIEPAGGWQAALLQTFGSELFGPMSTHPVPLEEIVKTLESTGRFVLGREELYRWDFAQAKWIPIEAGKLAGQMLSPGTALCLRAPAVSQAQQASTATEQRSRTATPARAGSLPRQPDVSLTDLRGVDGTPLEMSKYSTSSTSPPTLPYAISGFKTRVVDGRLVDAIGTITLPDSLLAMTDLPKVVPVRIVYTPETPPRPRRFEILGVASMQVGAAGHAQLLSPGKKGESLPLVLTPRGGVDVFGHTTLDAIEGVDPAATKARSVQGARVALVYTPQLQSMTAGTQQLQSMAGAKPMTGPAIDMAIGFGPGARAFKRWGTGTTPLPPDGKREIGPDVWVTDNFYVEYSRAQSLLLAPVTKNAWALRTLPATLRTTDGQSIAAAVASDVTSAEMALPALGILVPVAGVSPQNPCKVSYYPTGLVELHTSPIASIQLWGTEHTFSLHDPEDNFEFGFTPGISLGKSSRRELGAMFIFAPTISIRFKDFVKSDAGQWDDLMVTVTPRAELSVEKRRILQYMRRVGRDTLSTARGLARVLVPKNGKPQSILSGLIFPGPAVVNTFKDIYKIFDVDAKGITIGLATVARFNDAEGQGTHRMSLYATVQRIWRPGASGKEEMDGITKGGGSYEQMAVDQKGGAPIPWAIEVESAQRRSAGAASYNAITVSGSYLMPESWGFGSQKPATGKWCFSSTRLPDNSVINRSLFRSNELLSFRSKIDAVPFFDVGDGNTDLVVDLNELNVVLDARQVGTDVIRGRYIGGALFAGTVARGAGMDKQINARGFYLSLGTEFRTTGTEPAVRPVGQGNFLASLFPGPSVFGPGPIIRSETEAELTFQNFGTDKFRLESMRGVLATGQAPSKLFNISMGFQTPTTTTWARVGGTIEQDGPEWRVTGETTDVDLGSVTIQNAYLAFELGGQRRWYDGLRVGGMLKIDGPDSGELANSDFKIGLDLDLGARRGRAMLGLPGSLFCLESGKCPLLATGLEGSLDFSSGWGRPVWDLFAECRFLPPFLEGRAATVMARLRGEPRPTSLAAEVRGLMPKIEFPNIGGGFQITRLGLGFERLTRSIRYQGAGMIEVPPKIRQLILGLPDVGSKISFPTTIAAAFDGTDRRVQVLGTIRPPLGLQLTATTTIGITNINFTKASPWGLGMGAAINSAGKITTAAVSFDGEASTLSFIPDARAEIGFDLDGVAMSIRAFQLDLTRDITATAIRVSGRATVKVADASWSGTLAMRFGTDKSVTAQLTNLTFGKVDTIPDFGGVKVQPRGIIISSTPKTTGVGRTTGVTVAIGVSLDKEIFGPLGGREMIGEIGHDSDGNSLLRVTSRMPPLPLAPLPAEVMIRSLEIIRNKDTKETSVAGRAVLRLLRPINTVLGASGDTPFTFEAALGVGKEEGKTMAFVEAIFRPALKLAFNLLGAKGEMILPGVRASTGGQIELNLTLNLESPAKCRLRIRATNDFTGRVDFTITATPPLVIDCAPLFKIDFRKLAYSQAFPGFMGIKVDAGLNVGIDLFGFGVDLQDLIYILPSGIPPSGFPFFDGITPNLRLFGFAALATVALPPPNLTLSDALTLITAFSSGFGKADWEPLKKFLASKMTGPSAFFRGPGIGNIAFGLPMALREVLPPSQFPTATWWKNDPDLRLDVCELSILKGMYYATDLFSGTAISDAITNLMQTAQTIGTVFKDPIAAINLIPPPRRTGGFALDLGGMASASASYALLVPTVLTKDGRCEGIPAFDLLSELAAWLDSAAQSSVPEIAMVVQSDALGVAPFPLSNKPFSFEASPVLTVTGTINDTWQPLRDYVKAALELTEHAAPKGAVFDAEAVFGLHFAKIAGESGRLAARKNVLSGSDGRSRLTVYGSSGTISIPAPDGRSRVFTGSVPLGFTTTRETSEGLLELESQLTCESRKLISVVKAKLFSKGSSTGRELASPPSTELRRLDEPAWICPPADGRVAGWIADYGLDEQNRMRAVFTDYGTAKFTAPSKEFTSVYPGALLSDLRTALHALEPFKSIIYDYDSSPYTLGLAVWAKFAGGKELADKLESITTNGRTVHIRFRDQSSGQSLELRIVLRDIAAYLTADTDPETGEVQSLEGSADIERYVIDGKKLLAQPFTIGFNGAKAEVRDLLIFDGGPEMQAVLERCAKQKKAMQQTDLQQFAKLGLSVAGEPLMVRDLVLELDTAQMRVIIRPKSIKFQRLSDGYPILEITDGYQYASLMSDGPYEDKSTYPSEPGRFVAQSYNQTVTATTVFDLHEAMGTNDLIRTVTVNGPDRIAGTYTQMAPGRLQGALQVNGRACSVTADGSGMRCDFDADPSTLALSRNFSGAVSGKVAYNGAERSVDFYPDRTLGGKSEKFKYPTGKEEPGGFQVAAALAAGTESTFRVALSIEGEIKAGGRFKFAGDVDLTLLGRKLSEGRFMISSTEGFYIHGKLDMHIGLAELEGRIHAQQGAAFKGTLRVLPKGTGIDSTTAIDTNAHEKLKMRGDIKVANHTISTQEISLVGNEFKTYWCVGGSWAGVSTQLSFSYSGDFSISAKGSAWLKLLTYTAKVSLGFSVNADGTVSVCIGILKIELNIPKMRVKIELC